MTRTLPFGLLGCLLAAGSAVSACGAESPGDTSAATAWADKACGSIVQLQDLKNRQPTIELTDLAAAKRSISTFYGEAVAATDRGLGELAAAGQPPLANGADAASKFKSLLDQVRAAAVDAKDKIDAADPRDPKRFSATLTDIATALGINLQKATSAITELNSNREFRVAAATAPKCQQLQAPPTTGVSPSR
ncbi:MAG: hypothetical protein H0W01_14455 [Pseudonocardiales bacterium]|nr:hypothetical protein [Pseudonocardiales bacterium]